MFELGQRVKVKAEVAFSYEEHFWGEWECLIEPPDSEHPEKATENRWRWDTKRLYRCTRSLEGIIVGKTRRYVGWRIWIEEEGYSFHSYRWFHVYMIARQLRWKKPTLALEEDIEALGG